MVEIMADEKFDYFNVATVRLFAESRCFDDDLVSEDALDCLSGDLNYRLREIAHKCAIFMNQKRRRKLSVDDFNKTLKWYNCAPILGHKSVEPPKLHYLKELGAFVPNEGVVDLCDFALANNYFEFSSQTTLQSGLAYADDVNHNEKADLRLLELCKNALVELFSLSEEEFRKALQRVTEFCEKEDVSNLFFKIILNLLQNSQNEARINKILDVCNAVLHVKSIKTSLKIWPLVQKLTEILLELSINATFSSSSKKSCRILYFISRNFNQISSTFSNKIVLRWIEALSNEKNNVEALNRALFGLKTFSFELQFVDIKCVLLSHIERIFNSNDNIFSIDLIHYFLSWQSIVARIYSKMHSQNEYESKSSNFWTIFLIFNDLFGDSWTLNLPLCDFTKQIVETKKMLLAASPNLVSKEKILEDLVENAHNGEENASISNELVVERPQKSKKRKRKREPTDVFDIPKRFRLCHQRDIVFIFHQTEATTVKTGQKFVAEKCGRSQFSSIFNRKPFEFKKRAILKCRERFSVDFFDIRNIFL